MTQATMIEGYTFRPPYQCMCCGTGISTQQFMFSMICGRCDGGCTKTSPQRPLPDHELPPWWPTDHYPYGKELLHLFGEYQEAYPWTPSEWGTAE